MASKTKLLGIQEYDRDGGLDYYIAGSEWLKWYQWRAKQFPATADPVFVRAHIKKEIMRKFEQCIDMALRMDI